MMELKNKGITAFVPVYNEEKRIRYVLQSLVWCDEVLVLDKQSTDETVKIAQSFSNVKILHQEHSLAYTASEFPIFLNACTTKWAMLFTASDIIHPNLADKIKRLVEDETFNYDAIRVPYRPYMMGICEKYSPWYEEYSNRIVKTETIKIDESGVHVAYLPDIKSIYTITCEHKEEAYYHLTHETADGVIERYRRYWNGEAVSSEPLSNYIHKIIVGTRKFFLTRGNIFKGKAAIALSFSYLSYFMMSYVYKWDKQYSKTSETYARIRSEIMDEWKKHEEGKK